MDFYRIGLEAQINGGPRAPIANAQVREALGAETPVGSAEFRRICEEFARGYEAGVEAEIAAILG